MTTNQEIEELKRDCAYHEQPDEADFEVDDSVDALINYKDALEDRAYAEGAVLDRINAILSAPNWSVGMLEDICTQVRKIRPELDTEGQREILGGSYIRH